MNQNPDQQCKNQQFFCEDENNGNLKLVWAVYFRSMFCNFSINDLPDSDQ